MLGRREEVALRCLIAATAAAGRVLNLTSIFNINLKLISEFLIQTK